MFFVIVHCCLVLTWVSWQEPFEMAQAARHFTIRATFFVGLVDLLPWARYVMFAHEGGNHHCVEGPKRRCFK